MAEAIVPLSVPVPVVAVVGRRLPPMSVAITASIWVALASSAARTPAETRIISIAYRRPAPSSEEGKEGDSTTNRENSEAWSAGKIRWIIAEEGAAITIAATITSGTGAGGSHPPSSGTSPAATEGTAFAIWTNNDNAITTRSAVESRASWAWTEGSTATEDVWRPPPVTMATPGRMVPTTTSTSTGVAIRVPRTAVGVFAAVVPEEEEEEAWREMRAETFRGSAEGAVRDPMVTMTSSEERIVLAAITVMPSWGDGASRTVPMAGELLGTAPVREMGTSVLAKTMASVEVVTDTTARMTDEWEVPEAEAAGCRWRMPSITCKMMATRGPDSVALE
mmetsp:Transcript_37357/g.78248  ORF Transcript_37357/g.78248 Transcript_37357/m.78248 type:complete len:336 (-) Transcript_37357:102-1109(-)